MPRAIVVLLAFTLASCASQPQVSLPPPDEQPSVMAPEPDAATVATDLAMFAERLRQVVALVVSDFLSPDYRTAE